MMVPRHTGVKPAIGGIRNEEYRKNLEAVMMPSRQQVSAITDDDDDEEEDSSYSNQLPSILQRAPSSTWTGDRIIKSQVKILEELR